MKLPEIEPLSPERAPEVAAMTFPVYRQLLSLKPTTRHPEQGDPRPIQPLAFVTREGDAAVGLIVGEEVLAGPGGVEMLSLFVVPDRRGRGIATALVARLETEAARRGSSALTTVYTVGKPSIAAVERILWKRGWEAPQVRTLSVRFTPEAFLASDLFSERRMRALGSKLELFPWIELTGADRDAIRASNERQPWITPALAHWRFELGGFDALSSIGARYEGEVVGWVINHVVSPGLVRFTCSFLRKDLSRRGRIVPLYRESLRRLVDTDCRLATLVTPVEYPNMIRFLLRWIAPIAQFVGETRGSRKELATAAAAADPTFRAGS